MGAGFCWSKAVSSPDSSLLAVDGCYWSSPFEISVYEFSNPDSIPYNVVCRGVPTLDYYYDWYEILGWSGNDSLALRVTTEVRISDKSIMKNLSVDEYDKAIDDDDIEDVSLEIVAPLSSLKGTALK
jgi:hypothetical protein